MLRTTPPKMRLGRVGVNTADWLKSARLAARNRRRYPHNYMVLAYEHLVSQPDAALHEVCAFVGEEYVRAMLTLDGAISFGAGPEAGTSSELETGIVEFRPDASWKIQPREVSFMQKFAHREMAARGYDARTVQLSPMELFVHYGFDWPLNLARVVIWRSQAHQDQ
jgi:hypothetical protein